VAGNWAPDPYGAFPGIAAGGTDIVCCNGVVPKELMNKVMVTREEIIKGTKQVFSWPLIDRDGTERVAAGNVPRRRQPLENGLEREGSCELALSLGPSGRDCRVSSFAVGSTYAKTLTL
jgi:hypothetical protein